MINTFILEGKIRSIGEMKTNQNGIRYLNLAIECERNYRNYEGIYETDIVEIEVFHGMADIIFENCKAGDFVSIQGKIQSSLKNQDERKYIVYKFVAEKVSFLS